MIQINGRKCLLCITEEELGQLIQTDPELHRRALRRGKHEQRRRTEERREQLAEQRRQRLLSRLAARW